MSQRINRNTLEEHAQLPPNSPKLLEFLSSLSPKLLEAFTTTYLTTRPYSPESHLPLSATLLPLAPAPPRAPVDWTHPALAPLADARETLRLLESRYPKGSAPQRKYRAIIIDISKDARTCLNTYLRPIPPAPTQPPQPSDPFLQISLANSQHVRAIFQHYSALAQSDNPDTKYLLWHLDHAVEQSGLQPWQQHLLLRRVDGAPQVTIGGELARQFGKFLSPSGMSNHMAGIYKQIARTAQLLQTKHNDRKDPTKWRKCRKCGEKFHIAELRKDYCKANCAK